MIQYLILTAMSILAIEMFMLFPFLQIATKIKQHVMKSTRLINNPGISDHWKEKVLLSYSLTIMKYSLILFALLCGFFLMVIALLALIDYQFELFPTLIELSSSMKGTLFIVIISTLYYLVKKYVK
jgi:hypothetical protein